MSNNVIIDFHYLRNTNKGFGQYCLNLAQHLQHEEFSDLNLTYYVPKQWRKHFGNSVNYKTYYSFHKHFNFIKNYDIFHGITHLSKIEPTNSSNTKFVYTIHDAIFSLFEREDESTKIRYKQLQEKIDKSSALVYISDFTKQNIQNKFNIPEHTKEYTIYNGNPFEGLKPVKSKHFSFRYLLSVGEFRGYKNQDKLIPMLKYLDKDIKLIFIGKCSKEKKDEINKLANSNDVLDRVIIKGIVSEKEKIELYSNALALLHPSLAEGFGLPVVEAMTFGIPVIISNKTSLPEVGGKVAYYMEHYNPEYMADIVKEALNQFQQNPKERAMKLISQAEQFSWRKSAKQYLQVYRDI